MSANLDELSAERADGSQVRGLDDVMKKEAETFVQRYCFGYQHKVAMKELEQLIIQARTHR